jgi:hypothetical protein
MGEGLAIWVPWPVLSGRGMDGHGQARTNTDGLVRECGISQDPWDGLTLPTFLLTGSAVPLTI